MFKLYPKSTNFVSKLYILYSYMIADRKILFYFLYVFRLEHFSWKRSLFVVLLLGC